MYRPLRLLFLFLLPSVLGGYLRNVSPPLDTASYHPHPSRRLQAQRMAASRGMSSKSISSNASSHHQPNRNPSSASSHSSNHSRSSSNASTRTSSSSERLATNRAARPKPKPKPNRERAVSARSEHSLHRQEPREEPREVEYILAMDTIHDGYLAIPKPPKGMPAGSEHLIPLPGSRVHFDENNHLVLDANLSYINNEFIKKLTKRDDVRILEQEGVGAPYNIQNYKPSSSSSSRSSSSESLSESISSMEASGSRSEASGSRMKKSGSRSEASGSRMKKSGSWSGGSRSEASGSRMKKSGSWSGE